MADDFRDTLLHMLTAPTLEATTTLAVEALQRLIPTAAAALLIWDVDLDRYIVGETRAASPDAAPHFRRQALGAALAAYHSDSSSARCLADGLFYQPLNTPDGNHVGAYVYGPVAGPSPDCASLIRAATRAVWVMTRIEQADREHTQLHEDHERLQQLLYAVDQQQQTIDRLLTLERQFSASLEAQVEERTAALREAQARVVHSEKLAVIGQLAASLAHEINNPLQAIQSGLGLVVSELGSGQIEHVHGDLLVIQAELDRMETIFRQMLDFNQPAAHVRTPLDLNAICEGVRVLLRKKLQEARIELRLELAPQLRHTCGDSGQIKQVLINLILNGAEAMPASGGVITVGTRSMTDDVQLFVRDSGSGIHAQHLSQLFEPFFTTKTRGLGLGLAISREIITRHDGRITVNTVEGEGTTFTIDLPIKERCHDD
jgi:C4-dicarboxylate-specific signal transduction histidine kinase